MLEILSFKSVLLYFAAFMEDHFENYMLFIYVFPNNKPTFFLNHIWI